MKTSKKIIILGILVFTVLICINTIIVSGDIVLSRAFAIESSDSTMYEAKMIEYYNSVNLITKSIADRDATLLSRVLVALVSIFSPYLFVKGVRTYNGYKRKMRKARVN